MKLELIRIRKGTESTLGTLLIDGVRVCSVLEDTDRELSASLSTEQIAAIKIHGRTAIPTGRYKVVMSLSNRFKKVMPELLLVPGFAGIRIHAGNTIADTEGCLLVGVLGGPNKPTQDANGYWRVWDSRATLDLVQRRIRAGCATGEVFIDIKNQYA